MGSHFRSVPIAGEELTFYSHSIISSPPNSLMYWESHRDNSCDTVNEYDKKGSLGGGDTSSVSVPAMRIQIDGAGAPGVGAGGSGSLEPRAGFPSLIPNDATT